MTKSVFYGIAIIVFTMMELTAGPIAATRERISQGGRLVHKARSGFQTDRKSRARSKRNEIRY